MEDALVRNDFVGLVELMKQAIAGALMGEDEAQIGKKSLETLKTVLQSSLNTVNTQITSLNKLDVVGLATASGNTLLEVDNVQCFEPRGRFNLKVTSTNILLEGKQFSVLIPIQNVQQIVALPSFTSAKKEGEDYLALTLDEPVKVNTKESTNILLNLSRVTNPSTRSPVGDCDLTESDVVMMAIQDATGVHITRPQANLFSTLRDQKPYLKCYRGTQEGAIYPIASGIVFVKPLLFISADEIASIGAGRGGGSGNTRYVDLNIETADEKVYEFTNIDREELPALQMYIKGYLEVRAAKQQARVQKEARAAIKAEKNAVVDLDGEVEEEVDGSEDSSDEEDDDYNSDASNSDDTDSDNSQVSDEDSDNSDADSDAEPCSSKKERQKSPKKKAKVSQASSPSPAKPTAAAPKKSPGKKAAKSAPSPAKKATSSATPGMSIKRESALPGQPVHGVVDLSVGENAPGQAAVKGKEGRKTSAPVKKTPKEAKPSKGSASSKSSEGVVTSTVPGSVVVKKEPSAPTDVIRLDDPEVQEVFIKPEPKVVVDLVLPKVETIDPAVAAARLFTAAKTASSSVESTAETKKAVAAGSSASAAPAVGAKRTIMDLFAAQKKPTLDATVKVEANEVVKIE